MLVLAASVLSGTADFTPWMTNSIGGYDVNLHETVDGTPNGTPSEQGPLLSSPVFLDPGYLVLMDQGNPDNPADYSNPLYWSDVVHFTYSTVQLLSSSDDGQVTPWFPSVATVLANPHLFIRESALVPTLYPAGQNRYYIWSYEPVPEPSQVASGLLVLLGAAGYAVRHYRRRP